MKDFDKDINTNTAYELIALLQDAIMATNQQVIPVVVEDENGRIEHITHIWLDKERGMIRLSVADVDFIDHNEDEEDPYDPRYQFTEVRCDYFNDDEGLWYIDAWRGVDDDEEGIVVAKVNPETCAVTFTDERYRLDIRVQETICDVLKDILEGNM